MIELSYKDVYLKPRKCNVFSRSNCFTNVTLGAYEFTMPVYPANMKSVVNYRTCELLASRGWFYTMHRFGHNNVDFVKFMRSQGLLTSISTGINWNDYAMLEVLRDENLIPDYITIDIANAWNERVNSMIHWIREELGHYPFLIVGNVATKEAVEDLQEWGADAIKVGIAGGHVCTTKSKTGFARPMITAIQECVSVAKMPIIADGGITTHGDIAKALACGASMVMCGHLFSGYDESAGDIVEIDGKKYKEYYGSASEHNKAEKRHIEGRKELVPYKGPMEPFLKELKEDLQSSISYAGGDNVTDLQSCELIEVK